MESLAAVADIDDEIIERLHLTVANLEESVYEDFAGVDGPGLTGVATVLSVGTVFWCSVFAAVLYSPLAEKLSTKHYNGPLAAKVEVTDRILAFLHAAVSGSFGVYAWAQPWGLCSYDPGVEVVMRFGVALTTSYLVYDFALVIIAEGVMQLREPSWGLWIHHVNILPFFAAGLFFGQISWFMCANLLNELSTLPLHCTFFMHQHGMNTNPLFYVSGLMLVVTFLMLRVVAIAGIAVLFGKAGSCAGAGSPRGLIILSWLVVSVHWILNAYWYAKIMKMILFKKEKTRESVPLIATEAGLGPTPPEDSTPRRSLAE
jgi:hypothetical protein